MVNAIRTRYPNDLHRVADSSKLFVTATIMIIRYGNGHIVEGILLSRTERAMRVSIPGFADVTEFHQANGTWVSADCEAVEVEFAWMRSADRPIIAAEECVCSKELTDQLILRLLAGEDGDMPQRSYTVALTRDGNAFGIPSSEVCPTQPKQLQLHASSVIR
jgi:hypothetical protein